jgi:hypothetical protein
MFDSGTGVNQIARDIGLNKFELCPKVGDGEIRRRFEVA